MVPELMIQVRSDVIYSMFMLQPQVPQATTA
jgi:hypothetical protein